MWGISTGKLEGNEIISDGGPALLLQKTAAAHWKGAENYGEGECDYDLVFEAEDWCIHRYERDMILFGGEGGIMMTLPSGAVAISQIHINEQEITEAVQVMLEDITQYKSFPFHIQDNSVRLLPAGDDGEGTVYGYVEAPVYPGIWTAYLSEENNDRILLLLHPPAK